MEYSNVIISAFKATDDLIACLKYVEGHAEVLKSFGLGGAVTSSTPEWVNDSDTYVVTAACAITGAMLGGGRVQLNSEHNPLPMVSAIEKIDKKIVSLVNRYAPNGVAEMCGLWISRKAKGLNLGFTIIQSALVTARQVNISTLIGFAAPITAPFVQRLGFMVEPSVGDNGEFAYPTPEYISTIMILRDMDTLRFAEPEARKQVLRLTSGSIDQEVVQTKQGKLMLNYALQLNDASKLAEV